MPIIIRIAANLSPWDIRKSEMEWLELLIEESDRVGNPETGLSTEELNNAMSRKTGRPKVAHEVARAPLLRLCYYKLAENRKGNFVPTGAGRKVAEMMGQRAKLWGALLKLVETGKLSPQDVLGAVQKGYKKDAAEILGLIGKEE